MDTQTHLRPSSCLHASCAIRRLFGSSATEIRVFCGISRWECRPGAAALPLRGGGTPGAQPEASTLRLEAPLARRGAVGPAPARHGGLGSPPPVAGRARACAGSRRRHDDAAAARAAPCRRRAAARAHSLGGDARAQHPSPCPGTLPRVFLSAAPPSSRRADGRRLRPRQLPRRGRHRSVVSGTFRY